MIVASFEGRLTREPRRLKNGLAFSLATYGGQYQNEAKERVLSTYWLNCIINESHVAGKLNLGAYKVEGYLKPRKPQTVNGKVYDQPTFIVESYRYLDGAATHTP